MNFAYGWAFATPLRKIFYNIAVTGLPVAVALLIGTVELAGLLAQKLGAQGAFWTSLEHIGVNTLGLIVVGMFVATWATAVVVWRFGHIEEGWSAGLEDRSAAR